jgi:hypothetical protein
MLPPEISRYRSILTRDSGLVPDFVLHILKDRDYSSRREGLRGVKSDTFEY